MSYASRVIKAAPVALRRSPTQLVEEARADRYFAQLRKRASSIRMLFVIIVVLPTALAGIYYGLIAAKRYVSESEYIVRGVTARRSGGIDALLSTFGISRTADDTSAIQNFMLSRDAISQLAERLPLRDIYTRPESDFIAGYRPLLRADSFESLFDYMRGVVTVVQNPTKGITTLRVTAFRAEDAHRIATVLLELAEDMVNRMNERAQVDTVRSAADEVQRAQEQVTLASGELTAFRNRELLVDPSKFSATLLEGIGKLSEGLAQTTTELNQASTNSPSSPFLAQLRARQSALEQKISAERSKLGGDDAALSGKVATYERLTLTQQLAEKSFAGALSALIFARQEARRQQIYVEQIVRPNLPDEGTEPERGRSVLTVFVLCFGIFAMLWIVTVGARDHAQ